jgi:hypothetical protein
LKYGGGVEKGEPEWVEWAFYTRHLHERATSYELSIGLFRRGELQKLTVTSVGEVERD